MNQIKKHFPSSVSKFKVYSKIFWPVIFGSALFALNGFVDNFMVGKYDAAGSLSAANSWTGIVMGIYAGIAIGSAIVMGQYYYSGHKNMAISIAKIRFLLSMSVGLLFAIGAWSNPRFMNSLFLKGSGEVFEEKIRMANTYLKYITIQWLLIAITFNYGSMLREYGHGKAAFIWGIGSLLINMILNYVLMYVFNIGVEGAAYATIGARIFVLIFGTLYIRFSSYDLNFSVFTIFNIKKETWMHILRRAPVIFVVSSSFIFVNARISLFNVAYPVGDVGKGLGANDILGLTSAITNIFFSTFSALSVMSTYFVASELGKNNIEQAKINSNELKGFNTLMATLLSIVLIIIAIFIPKFSFLVNGTNPNIDYDTQLRTIRHCIWIVGGFYPLWIWFSTSYRNALAGGKSFFFTMTEFSYSFIQIGYLAMLAFLPLPQLVNFEMFYLIFFISDIPKAILYEIIYYKSNWAHNITQAEKAL